MQIIPIPFEIAHHLAESVRGALCHATLVKNTGLRHITTFRSTADRIYDGGPIIIKYYIECYIITLTIVLQLHTVFSTVTCCTGL
jgi:hypothetical protein